MTDLKKYIRDLKIIKNNLTKFYYHSSSEWLKPEILKCINSINMEILSYQKLFRKYSEREKEVQTTIFTYIKEGEIKCQTIKL